MDSADPGKRPRGRPPGKRAQTKSLPLALDEATCQKLDALIKYGGFGTTRQEIIKFVLRHWFWENEDRLRDAVGSKDNPFGPPPKQGD